MLNDERARTLFRELLDETDRSRPRPTGMFGNPLGCCDNANSGGVGIIELTSYREDSFPSVFTNQDVRRFAPNSYVLPPVAVREFQRTGGKKLPVRAILQKEVFPKNADSRFTKRTLECIWSLRF